jgi:hypothetical protein
MKQVVKHGNNLVPEFWLSKVHEKFIAPSLCLKNGELLTMLLM